MSSSNDWFVKMRPLLGLTGFGGGGTGINIGGAAVPFQATGGDQNGITPGNGYKYHTFYSEGPATFTVTAGIANCKIMVLGGGGGGAQSPGGGGAGAGAGGLVYHDEWELAPGTYDVNIGIGGASNSGGPDTPGPGGSPACGGPGGNSTFSSPTFTATGRGGHAGNNSPSFPGPNAGGCGMGGGWYGGNPEQDISGGQYLETQPGVPAGFVNYGQPGAWTMSEKPKFSHTPIAPEFGPTHPTMPTWYPQSCGGGGGGCGMAGIGMSMQKYSPPTNGSPAAGKWNDLLGGSGGSGWAGPPVFKIPDVFGPNAPTVSGKSPTNNMYGGGGGACIGPHNKNNIPATVWTNSPAMAPNPWPNPTGFGIVEQPTGQWMANHGGYGGGGSFYSPTYPWPTSTPTVWPWASSRKHGTDKLGGGGASQDYAWPNHPTHPAAGDGGTGLVVIAYVDTDGGGSEWNDNAVAIPVALWGGGGGGGEGSSPGGTGGGGGYYNGTINLPPGDYTFCVGSAGATNGDGEGPGGSGYGGAPIESGNGGGGGGYSGFFREDFTDPSPNPIPMKGMNKWASPGQPLPASAPGPIVGNQWYMGPGDAADYYDLNVLQQHCIFLVGGGGACAEAPAGGGGGGGYDSGDPGDDGSSTWPFAGAGQGGQNSPTYGGRGGYGGAGGVGDVGYGRPGNQMMGGWIGDINHGGGPGGGGYWGGGEGGAQSGGSNTEMGGGGSGHIDPAWVSPGATGETGNPGLSNGNAGGQSDPLYPGSAGQGGVSDPNAGCTAGSVVFGPHSGTLAVTPPGGSPSPVPASGQAFDTAGQYKLTVS